MEIILMCEKGGVYYFMLYKKYTGKSAIVAAGAILIVIIQLERIKYCMMKNGL
jgi:hypothetical protein